MTRRKWRLPAHGGRRAGALVFAAHAVLGQSVLGQDDQLRLPRLGVPDREGGYRYQATHPVTGNAWPLSVLDIWRALAFYAHPQEACLVNFYDFSARMGLH
jgi:alkylated DNA repair dioxygenase AlkB